MLETFTVLHLLRCYVIINFCYPKGKDPAPIDLKGEPLPNSRVADLPIAVIASNRPQYLYRMLRGLLSVPGSNPAMVTVYIDGFFDEPAAVSRLFNVKPVHHTPVCSKNCRIGQVCTGIYETRISRSSIFTKMAKTFINLPTTFG